LPESRPATAIRVVARVRIIRGGAVSRIIRAVIAPDRVLRVVPHRRRIIRRIIISIRHDRIVSLTRTVRPHSHHHVAAARNLVAQARLDLGQPCQIPPHAAPNLGWVLVLAKMRRNASLAKDRNLVDLAAPYMVRDCNAKHQSVRLDYPRACVPFPAANRAHTPPLE
jgi:hypothetical protein